jgi:hypothetical protein
MKNLLRHLFLGMLLIVIISGCGVQKDIIYNTGDSIEVCSDFSNVVGNKDSVHFWLKMLNSNKSDSETTWSSSDDNIEECYDLSKMKWDLAFSSLGTDYDMNFYDAIYAGEYSLTVSMATLEDDGKYTFTEKDPIKFIIK